MIQANELRIGNYVYDDQGLLSIISGFKPYDHSVRCDEDEGCVLLIDILNHGEISRGWETDLCFAKPIPLTEEILLKSGFKHKGNGYYEILGYFIELCNVGNEFYNCGFKGKSIGNIKHLHQLQNLYFSLIGKELEINL